tara:strand:- start:515 stop:676 length:162 start_codon:yes stop_codon:yes gene_type:complete
LLKNCLPFYEFPASQIFIFGALATAAAIAVFFIADQTYLDSPLNKELTKRREA